MDLLTADAISESRPAFEFSADSGDDGRRLDQVLVARVPDRSRAALQRDIEAGGVLLNGTVPRHGARSKVRSGDRVRHTPPRPRSSQVAPEAIPLQILFEDAAILVVDKPAGLVVHPSSTRFHGTLVAAVLHHLGRGAATNLRPGIVHRLDKDTTGVIIVAKSEAAEERLGRAFRQRAVVKTYRAVVHGRPSPAHATIETLFGRHPRHRKRFSSRVAVGKVAVTRYEILDEFRGASLLEVRIETGRTHQIRVHLADRGHPLLGDPIYGSRTRDPRLRAVIGGFARPALHAFRLELDHPESGLRQCFEAPIAPDLGALLEALRADAKRGPPT